MNKKFHSKSDDKAGFVITVSNKRIYHTCDADDIAEMSAAKSDAALCPCRGRMS